MAKVKPCVSCLLGIKGKEVREVGQVADEQIVSIISQH